MFDLPFVQHPPRTRRRLLFLLSFVAVSVLFAWAYRVRTWPKVAPLPAYELLVGDELPRPPGERALSSEATVRLHPEDEIDVRLHPATRAEGMPGIRSYVRDAAGALRRLQATLEPLANGVFRLRAAPVASLPHLTTPGEYRFIFLVLPPGLRESSLPESLDDGPFPGARMLILRLVLLPP